MTLLVRYLVSTQPPVSGSGFFGVRRRTESGGVDLDFQLPDVDPGVGGHFSVGLDMFGGDSATGRPQGSPQRGSGAHQMFPEGGPGASATSVVPPSTLSLFSLGNSGRLGPSGGPPPPPPLPQRSPPPYPKRSPEVTPPLVESLSLPLQVGGEGDRETGRQGDRETT